MMTGMTMKLNISWTEIQEFYFHMFKNIYDSMIKILNPKES